MSWPTLRLDADGAVAVLTLDRPSRANALNAALHLALVDAQIALEADDAIRVVVVTGSGRHFCGGQDLQDTTALPAGLRIGFDRLTKPVIAAINGTAVGGGLELAMACDLRVAQAEATVGLPEITFGELPAGGATARLTRLVGASQAKRLIMTGARIACEEARQLGLVDIVAQQQDFWPVVMELARAIAARPAYATRAAKFLIDRSLDLDLESALQVERRLTATMATPEERQRARRDAAAADPTYSRIFAAPSGADQGAGPAQAGEIHG